MVLVTFIDDEVDTQVFVVNAIHRVANDACITIPLGVVLVNNQLFVILVVLLDIFRSLENSRAVVVVKIFLHPIDGPQGMQCHHIRYSIHNGRTKGVQGVEMATLFGFLHRSEYLTIGKVLIANHIDFSNLHLVALINIDDHVNIVLAYGIRLLFNVDIHVEITFVVEKILYDAGCLGHQVFCSDIAARQVDFVANVVGLALLDTIEREL